MSEPNSKQTSAQQFKTKYYKDDDSVVLPYEDDSTYLEVKNPRVLASFVAFCSTPNRRVFFRGATGRHRYSVPSLFRIDHGKQCDNDQLKRRWRAYRCLVDELHQQLKGQGTRWNERAMVGSILQHYGIKTPWLDVVRNLYTAIWFATHEVETRGNHLLVSLSNNTHGHIAIYCPEMSAGLEHVDLWDSDSSRHVRPHAQHGISLAKQCDDADAPLEQQDFSKPYRIAQVCFPNSLKWALCGYMFSAGYFFPDPEHDTSLKQLCSARIEGTLDKVCRQHGVGLGVVTRYMCG